MEMIYIVIPSKLLQELCLWAFSGNLNQTILQGDDAFFNRNWAGACEGRWVRPRLLMS